MVSADVMFPNSVEAVGQQRHACLPFPFLIGRVEAGLYLSRIEQRIALKNLQQLVLNQISCSAVRGLQTSSFSPFSLFSAVFWMRFSKMFSVDLMATTEVKLTIFIGIIIKLVLMAFENPSLEHGLKLIAGSKLPETLG